MNASSKAGPVEDQAQIKCQAQTSACAPLSSTVRQHPMLVRWLERQLGDLFLTFFEVFRAIRLRRPAPFLAVVALVAVIGIALLALLDAFAHAAGRVSIVPISTAPRSIAAIAILSGYYLWGSFASPERIALMESLDATSPPGVQSQRRLKVAALVAVLILVYLALSKG